MNGINLNQKLEMENLYIQLSIITIKQENSLHNVHETVRVKLLSHLRLQFIHLNKHKFRHGFSNTVNPMCQCSAEVETTEHFFLHCHCFSTQRTELFNALYNLNSSFAKLNSNDKVAYILHGSTSNSNSLNKDKPLKMKLF